MRRFFLLFFCVFLLALPVTAQTINPDYGIRNISSVFENNNTQLRLQFTVSYTGSTASPPTELTVLSVNTGNVVAQQTITTLNPNATESISLLIPVSDLGSGLQSFRINLSSESGELLAVSPISVNIPAQAGTDGSTPEIPDGGETGVPEGQGNPLVLSLFGFSIDLNDPANWLAIGGILLALLLFVVVIFVLLRMIFRRGTPAFAHWQPPYATSPMLNPNSQAARQQGWQLHAQNDQAPPPYTSEGATHIRKILTGLDGKNLENWHITAMRMSQYDQYGRVARSQALISNGLVRRLDRAARSSEGEKLDKTINKISPISKALVNALSRKINQRSAMLPVALDMRLQGKHGEVRILFELFSVQNGQWGLLDRWEPDMVVVSKSIEESFTYSLYGMRPDETYKTYLQRLQSDLTRLLVEMVNKSPGANAAAKEDTGQQKAQKAES